jgi:hypothetical protein
LPTTCEDMRPPDNNGTEFVRWLAAKGESRSCTVERRSRQELAIQIERIDHGVVPRRSRVKVPKHPRLRTATLPHRR